MVTSWRETNVKCADHGHRLYEAPVKSLDPFVNTPYTFHGELFESMSCQCCCWPPSNFIFFISYTFFFYKKLSFWVSSQFLTDLP